MDTPTLVLVHGAWHGGWAWDEVRDRLHARGLATLAPDLPGHGDDPGPLADLDGDAAAVRAALDTVDGPVVLIGHSYGGAVITVAGHHPAVRHLVYVAAFAPDEGESVGGLAATEEPPSELGPIMHRAEPDSDDLVLEPDGAVGALYHDVEPERAAAAVARLGPESLSGFLATVGPPAWRTTPATYVLCTDDRAVRPMLQRRFADRCGATVELASGHCPMLSMPDELAAVLAEVAGAAEGAA